MCVPSDIMEYLLNETTRTVHKQERGAASPQAVCGATYHLDPGQLQRRAEQSPNDFEASKCGRCFEGGRGY